MSDSSNQSSMLGIENEPINDLTIIEYVKHIRNKYYPDMDIEFMNSYMSLIKNDTPNDKYYISSDKLAEYGVLSIKQNRQTLDVTHVKRYLDRIEVLKENTDYIFRILHVEKSEDGTKPRGRPERHLYMLTRLAFSTCLLVSTNESKYRIYYLLLEECVKYYNEQQIVQKNNIINTLLRRLDESILESQIKTQEHNAMMALHIKQHSEITQQLTDLQTQMSEIVSKLKHLAIPPKDAGKINCIAVMQSNSDGLISFIAQQRKSFNRAIKTKIDDDHIKLGEFLDVPNAIYLALQLMEYLKEKDYVKKHKYRSFTLINSSITSERLLELMKEVYEERKLI